MIIFVKVKKIGNKFVLEDSEGNNMLRQKFVDTKEEAEQIAQEIRYCMKNDDEYDDEVTIGKGMFWDWWNDLCQISGGDNQLAQMYFFDKAYQPRNENLEDYLDDIRSKT